MDRLTIIKVGGKIVEEDVTLQQLLADFSKIEGAKILVHGGGRLATKIAGQLGIESRMIDGRRITDEDTLQVVIMVYAGLVNKKIVAGLQALKVNAIGLTGADMNMMRAEKRPVVTIDYGYAGDVKEVNASALALLLQNGFTPVLSPLTHDKKGQLLNTNADTIAAETAKALASFFDVTLIYCFEKSGVLLNENDDNSIIPQLNRELYEKYKAEGVIQGGMIPKLDNAFQALDAGVRQVIITKASAIAANQGTEIRVTGCK